MADIRTREILLLLLRSLKESENFIEFKLKVQVELTKFLEEKG